VTLRNKYGLLFWYKGHVYSHIFPVLNYFAGPPLQPINFLKNHSSYTMCVMHTNMSLFSCKSKEV
jgi:hypothetical protein